MKTYSANIQRQLLDAGFILEKSEMKREGKNKSLHKLVCAKTKTVYMQGDFMGELLCRAAKEMQL